MSDEQAAPQQDDGAQVDPAEAAYEQALTGGADPYGVERPAREVYAIEGVPAEQAEQEARERLEEIQKLRGTQPTGYDPPPRPEQPAEQAAGASEPAELSREQVAERLLYGSELPYGEQPMPPEQAAAIEAMQNERAFHSGEAAQMAVEVEGEYESAREELIGLPGTTSDAFMQYAEAPWARMVDAYDLEPESVASLDVLRQLYEQSGGEQRWRGEAEAQAQAEAYEKALSGGPPRHLRVPDRGLIAPSLTPPCAWSRPPRPSAFRPKRYR